MKQDQPDASPFGSAPASVGRFDAWTHVPCGA